MSDSPNVVHLNARDDASERRSSTRTPPRLAPILDTVRENASKQLEQLLVDLFSNADDALFEMADRSRNDRDYHMYFDSMRVLRLNRSRIQTEFLQSFSYNFKELCTNSESVYSNRDDASDVSAANLSLLGNDDLEMSVAVTGMVSKITSQFSLQIMQLTRRIDAICAGVSVSEKTNPVGPHALAHAFANTLADLEVDIRIRLILLKLFERFVMERLGSCYDMANRMLADAGVLTELKTAMRRAQPKREPATSRAAQQGQSVAAGATGHTASSGTDADFALLQALLSNAAGGASRPGASTAAPAWSTPELLSALNAAQSEAGTLPVDMERPPKAINLGQLLNARSESVGTAPFTRLDHGDEDTVNLIGMLFDYILNDCNLAIPMKALIGRLQIPMLKTAILDKSFFSKSSHPARRLLNELSSAGIGWSNGAELKRDALYNKIESIVQRVLDDFGEDPMLFESLTEELREFVEQDHRRAQKVAQRVKETETGKAKTLAAKRTVQQLLNHRASGLRLPPAVSRFIAERWSRVLVYLAVSLGAEHPRWREAVETLDELLWCVQPLDDDAELARRDARVPDLLARIEAGLEQLNLPASEIARARTQLRETLDDISAHDRSFLEDAEAEMTEADERAVMEEIVLMAPEEAGEDDDTASYDDEPELVSLINRITEGVWVELTESGGAKRRCKLAAIVQPGNKYVFVNRRGMKVKELSRMALAVALKENTLVPLDESEVFERALEAVIVNLRRGQRGGGPA